VNWSVAVREGRWGTTDWTAAMHNDSGIIQTEAVAAQGSAAMHNETVGDPAAMNHETGGSAQQFCAA
jgi:hypothetical protein